MMTMEFGTAQDAFTALFADFEKCEEIISVMRGYRMESFIPIYCMIAEEWAKAHGEDVCNLINTVCELVRGVNAQCGQY